MMTSPIATRNRAVVSLDTPVLLFDEEETTSGTDALHLLHMRKPLFPVAHISTGNRFLFDHGMEETGVMDKVQVDFWRCDVETNGPHHSSVILLPSFWPTNLCLCVIAKSVRENGVVSVYNRQYDHSIGKHKTINQVHFLFEMNLVALKEYLNNSGDLNSAFGGTR
jgi:hypothetical protein